MLSPHKKMVFEWVEDQSYIKIEQSMTYHVYEVQLKGHNMFLQLRSHPVLTLMNTHFSQQ